ncbi:MAG: IS110 family transposase [Gammaproteobacteria bacterium]|nr:IS110 family transposase [Gammaproteobacteria bacterium]
MKNITVLGIDLAKNVFQLHGADSKGKRVLSKRLSREKLIEFTTKLSPCTIAIEACTGAHYWARMFKALGHEVRMISPQFVKPYVKSNKNDRNDAAAIAEAATRPEMKFVPIKQVEQQDILAFHRARELVVKQRTAQANQIRVLLAEYGVIIPKGIRNLSKLRIILEDNKQKLTPVAEQLFVQLHEQFKIYNAQVEKYEQLIETLAKKNHMCQELMKIDGVGPMVASAAVATIGDANVFKNGREVSAWLGLVPKQYSSGNTIRLGKISKRGDQYMRKLLVLGARNAVRVCEKKKDALNIWVADKLQRCGLNKAAVALANKNARIIWAILATGECYRKAA